MATENIYSNMSATDLSRIILKGNYYFFTFN